jgi:OmpA-OmpF porin, OOP family
MRSELMVIVGAAAMMASAPACGADEQTGSAFRFGLGGGRASIEPDDVNINDSTVVLELFLGYEFNRYFALESGYMYSGRVEEESVAVLDDTGAIYVSALGSLPIDDDMSVYARVGWLDWETDQEIRTDGEVLVVKNAEDDGALFGAGFAVMVEDALVRVEYRITDLDETDLSFLSLALVWRFGASR